MLPAACVVIEIVASRETPVDSDALLERCNGILGDGECHVDEDGARAAPSCWRATVALDERGQRAAVTLNGIDGRTAQRDVDFAERDRVADRWATLGLVVAALVTVEEHSAEARAQQSSAQSEAASPPPPAMPPPPPTPERPERTPAPEFEATLSGIAGVGFLPGVALGLRLEGSMYASWFGALVRGAYSPPRSEATVPVTGGTGGGRFGAWSLGAGACARAIAGAAWRFRGCAGGDVVVTTATGFGVHETSNASAATGAVWLGPAAELRLSPHVAVMLEADGVVALRRPEFSIRGASTVYAPERFGANFALGLTAVFR